MGFGKQFILVAACATLSFACEQTSDPVAPTDLGDLGKGDIVDHVVIRSTLGWGGSVAGEFSEDLQFDAYTLEVRSGAVGSLEVSRSGTSTKLDPTMYIYGPQQSNGSYGSQEVFFDDDSGWGKFPRLKNISFETGGKYLVVVGSRDGQGRGKYRVTATCPDDACEPVMAAGSCHPDALADILACVSERMADPELAVSARDAIYECADAEPLADVYDAICAADNSWDFCSSLEAFYTAQAPVCRNAALGSILDATCVLGSSYRDIFEKPELSYLSKIKITSAEGLSDLVRAQIVSAVQASSHEDVQTAEEALSRVDQEEINLVELWDKSNRQGITVFEYGAGDNSYGRAFVAGTTDIVASNHDTDWLDCAVMIGPEGRDCEHDTDCASGLRCVGVASEISRGQCINLDADTQAAQGTLCEAAPEANSLGLSQPDSGLQGTCPSETGLLCAGLSRGEIGMCSPAWTQKNFFGNFGNSIPDNNQAGTDAQIVVWGLATVDMDVRIRLAFTHPDPKQLKITLTNPAGNTASVFDGAIDAIDAELAPDFSVDLAPQGFSGDESVNGVWVVNVVDDKSGKTGTLNSVSLTVGSRWD